MQHQPFLLNDASKWEPIIPPNYCWLHSLCHVSISWRRCWWFWAKWQLRVSLFLKANWTSGKQRQKKVPLISRLPTVECIFYELADHLQRRLKPRVVMLVRCQAPLPRNPSSSILMKLTSLLKENLLHWHLTQHRTSLLKSNLERMEVNGKFNINKKGNNVTLITLWTNISIYYFQSALKPVNMYEGTKGKYPDCRLHFSWKENEERLEKHSGSNSKSHRSAVKGQPSWQQRYGGTMVNRSHASPNNTRQGEWLRNTDSPICLLVHTVYVHPHSCTCIDRQTPTIHIALLPHALHCFLLPVSNQLPDIGKKSRKRRCSSFPAWLILWRWCLNAAALMIPALLIMQP